MSGHESAERVLELTILRAVLRALTAAMLRLRRSVDACHPLVIDGQIYVIFLERHVLFVMIFV